MNIRTQVIHGGHQVDPRTGAVNMPIYQTTTFKQTELGGGAKWEYTRSENPTRASLEELIASLEHGTAGFAFSSGMSAIHAVMSTLSAGDHILLADDVYGGTFRLVNSILARLDITYDQVDMADLSAVTSALKPNTKMIFLETPTNPLLKLADIQDLSLIAHKHQATLAVDNTFATPYNQVPLDLGADFVIHSGTKYIGGHSDVLSGFVVTNDDRHSAEIKHLQMSIGATLGASDSYLVLRSLKTFALRMRAHNDNAQTLFNWLQTQSQVAKIYYPGDASSAQYAIAQKQMQGGFGGMISIELQAGLDVKKFVESLKIFTLAESLGGVESLVEVPAVMTHASIPADIRHEHGITDELIRISVGIEDSQDLIEDFQQGLAQL
ncbi:PLP-dependent aspartate aminotransferase family protein [Leuconostoc falkenbergense]|jgi:cysteine-S-conjugate beta-lyase|uniref:PLP-dependent aspartate aminotransferase family protein n=1 Tax=Leuconostoc falkenbergense TaxID=2766470 RepID=A0ABT7RXB3_9LACO|nr:MULTISPECIES: PLP-dependent aspartate aminotransferase family protein [Leuconostoc]RDG18379.1 methionine biosynthesis PLP-dependent protein [Leuconostoc pseudomesenteroides]MCT4389733.1 PLP-dependent transferase [Leuconostoc falkenbergense]MCT4411757.1 PLP-dependent transferase [Leuconostoc falkenbergense]MDM7645943.1 PLP-dependent aspartate aminotransferase family protein [Leuconostoc falkenbergense]MDV3545671.1 PLP-dependent aspartate aminotransferase family protein [Leuconostoc falkenber